MSALHRSQVLIATLLGLLIFQACRQTNQNESSTSSTPVILISIDTLRSDRLPVYGYDKVNTPAIDAFAKDAILFEQAFAQVPLTLPSHASMLTGKLPTTHGVRDNIAFALPEAEQTLTEALKEKGYATGAVVSSMVLRKEVGLAQGFDFYQDNMQEKAEAMVRTFAHRRGSESLPHALDWIKKQPTKPFFFFFHLYDPHVPYDPPAPFSNQYEHPYDGEIAFTDSLLERFFKELKNQDLYDKSLIILTSDHGEGLGDHEELEHGMFVYREAIQVPLLVKMPQQKRAGERVSQAVGLMDLTPSILATLGFPMWASDGQVIFGHTSQPKSRPIYSESMFAQIHYGWHPQQSTVQDHLHYIRGGKDQLFDLKNDPREQQNLFGTKRIPKPMLSLLEDVGTGVNNRSSISEEDLALLNSLGYAGLTSPTADILALSAADIVGLKDAFNECHQLIALNRQADAEKKLQDILTQYPTMMDARILLAVILREQNRYQEIEHLLAEGLANAPNNLRILTYLAEAKFRLKDLEGAQTLAKKAMGLDAEFAGEVLLPLFVEAGLKDEAEEIADQMLKNTDSPNATYLKSRQALEAGNSDEAIQLAKKALSEPINDADLRVKIQILLAESLLGAGDLDQAQKTLNQALLADPKAKHGRLILAVILDRTQQYQANIDQLKKGLSYSEQDMELLIPLVLSQLKAGANEAAFQTGIKALALDSQKASPPLSFYFLRHGPPEMAVRFAKKVLETDSASPYAAFVMGWVAHAQKNFQQALPHLQQAVTGAQTARDVNLLAEAAFYLGDASANLRQPRQAVEAFQLAIRARPDYPEAQVSMAALYALGGREQDALSILNRWLGTYPSKQNAEIAKNLLTQFGLQALYDKISRPNP